MGTIDLRVVLSAPALILGFLFNPSPNLGLQKKVQNRLSWVG